MRSLAFSLLDRGRIATTEAKAKEVRPFVEQVITRAKRGGIFDRRRVSVVVSPKIVKKVFGEIVPAFSGRRGGYTRIIKTGPRKSDGAKMAIIELIK